MTTFEIRRCDTCGEISHWQGRRPVDLDVAGWRRDEQGADICPSCGWDSSWTEYANTLTATAADGKQSLQEQGENP